MRFSDQTEKSRKRQLEKYWEIQDKLKISSTKACPWVEMVHELKQWRPPDEPWNANLRLVFLVDVLFAHTARSCFNSGRFLCRLNYFIVTRNRSFTICLAGYLRRRGMRSLFWHFCPFFTTCSVTVSQHSPVHMRIVGALVLCLSFGYEELSDVNSRVNFKFFFCVILGESHLSQGEIRPSFYDQILIIGDAKMRDQIK